MIKRIINRYSLFTIVFILMGLLNINEGSCSENLKGKGNNLLKKYYSYEELILEYQNFDIRKAWKYSDSLVSFALSSRNPEIIALAYNMQGRLYTSVNLYENAIEKYLIASKYAKLSKPSTQLIILNNKVSLYLSIGNPLIAMEIKQQMDALLPKVNQIDLVANTFQNYALIYSENNEPDSAFKYYMLSLEEYKKAKEDKDLNKNITKLYSNLGAMHFTLSEIDKAIGKYKKALTLCKDDQYSKSAICLNLGYAFLAINKFDSSYIFINKGVSIADSLNYKELQSNGYKFLSAYFDSIKEYKNAKVCLDKHIVFNESIISSNNQEKVWTIWLDFEEKQHQLQIQKQKLVYAFLFVITLLLSGIILLIINRQRIKHRKDSLIGKQKSEITEIQLKNLSLILDRKNQRLQEYTSLLKEKNLLIESFHYEIDNLLGQKDEIDIVDRKKKLLSMKILTNEDWTRFKQMFEEVNSGYLGRLKHEYEDLTEGDKRQFLLIKLGFDKKDAAEMLGISVEGAKRARQRLSKKLKLKDSGQLPDFILNY